MREIKLFTILQTILMLICSYLLIMNIYYGYKYFFNEEVYFILFQYTLLFLAITYIDLKILERYLGEMDKK